MNSTRTYSLDALQWRGKSPLWFSLADNLPENLSSKSQYTSPTSPIITVRPSAFFPFINSPSCRSSPAAFLNTTLCGILWLSETARANENSFLCVFDTRLDGGLVTGKEEGESMDEDE